MMSANSRGRSARRRVGNRRGASLVETAIVLTIFLMLLFGMFDLGIMLVRKESLAQAARTSARLAIVRGKYSDSRALGPTELSSAMSADNAIAVAARSHLVLMNPDDVQMVATWPDGSNEEGSRVRVVLSAEYTPIFTFIFGSPTWTLSATSEMIIAH
jgi:Flp pilus assembly protein TadG